MCCGVNAKGKHRDTCVTMGIPGNGCLDPTID